MGGILTVAGIAALVTKILYQPEFLYAGTIEATRIDISARIGTLIERIDVREGETVQKSSPLVKLASDDLRIAAQTAESDFARVEKLRKVGSVSQEIYEHARSKRDETATKLSWAAIQSPISGTVLDLYREEGEWVSPGTKILTLADLESVWATVYVPQPLLAKLSLGMEVDGILAEDDKESYKGKITRISDRAEFTPKNVQTREERQRLVYGIKVTFENQARKLKPGMTIEVRLPEPTD